MFGLFSKKEKLPFDTKDHIWISKSEKTESFISLLKNGSNKSFVISFFSDDLDAFAELLDTKEIQYSKASSDGQICLYNSEEFMQDRFMSLNNDQTKIYFLDHHPMPTVENKLLNEIGKRNYMNEVIFFLGLDEPLFSTAHPERIISMMKSLGLKENEMINHPMITKSIQRIQKKIENKVMTERRCTSAAEWFRINLPETYTQ